MKQSIGSGGRCSRSLTPVYVLKKKFPDFEIVHGSERGKVQSMVSAGIEAQTHLTFIESLSVSSAIRVLSGSAQGGAYWQAIPRNSELAVDTSTHMDIVCSTLGLPLSFLGVEKPCPCGHGIIDREGRHCQMTCKLGNVKRIRHDAVVEVWIQMLRRAGFHCTRESSNLLRVIDPQTQERTDITIHNWPGAVSHEFDVCITDARRAENGPERPVPGGVAEAAEKVKDTHYKARVEEAGGVFTPLVMEALGRFGAKATAFFKKAVHAVSLQTYMSKSQISTYWRQRIVVTMRRVGMQQLRLQALKLYAISFDAMVEEEEDILGIGDIEYVRA